MTASAAPTAPGAPGAPPAAAALPTTKPRGMFMRGLEVFLAELDALQNRPEPPA